MAKEYLGDGVYAEYKKGDIILTGEIGLDLSPSNDEIVLTPEAFQKLINFNIENQE